MAGHKAASVAPTWPTINGSWWPGSIFSAAVNLVENKISVHFVHRGLAYLLLLATLGFSLQAVKMRSANLLFQTTKWLPAFLILLQVLLGIGTVLTSPSIVPNHWGVFDWLAQLHQVVALLFLLTMVWMRYLVRSSRS